MLTLGPGNLTVVDLSQLGVARVSVGPALLRIAMKAYEEAADEILRGGKKL